MGKKDKVVLSLEAIALARIHADKGLRPNNFRRLVRQQASKKTRDFFESNETLEKNFHDTGISLLCASDDAWPKDLSSLKDPPVLMYTQGRPLSDVPVLGIVGSRSECPYALSVARSLVKKWSELHPEGRIVSGGGLGVDCAAWKAALEHDLSPIMVLAHGLGRPHIAMLKELYWTTTRKGTLLSEALPFTNPLPGMFPGRNRLIAALANVLVVVRGARRSGSLHTLNAAVKLKKTVFGVVGRIDDPGWFGIHDAIRSKKVRPLFHVNDLQSEGPVSMAPNDALKPIKVDPQEALVLEALYQKPLAIDDLAIILGLTAAPTMRLLLPLEIRGWIERTSGGCFQISHSSKAHVHMARSRSHDPRQ